jgi:hypothetical protein
MPSVAMILSMLRSLSSSSEIMLLGEKAVQENERICTQSGASVRIQSQAAVCNSQ